MMLYLFSYCFFEPVLAWAFVTEVSIIFCLYKKSIWYYNVCITLQNYSITVFLHKVQVMYQIISILIKVMIVKTFVNICQYFIKL